MSYIFRARSLQQEQMDTQPLDDANAARVLRTLETINRWLGGVRATLSCFERWSKQWKPGETIRVIDWGAGGGDLARAIVRWGRDRGFTMHMTGVDNHHTTVEYARSRCQLFPEIQWMEADLMTFESDEPYDYAISSLTLHHLPDEVIVALLQKSDRLARRGIVMNDLKRSARAWAWIWLLSRLARAHPMVRNDGPLSVRRAFVRSDLEALARTASLPYLKVQTHFGYRYTLAGEKPS